MSADFTKSQDERLGFAWWTFQGWMSLIGSVVGCISLLRDLGGLAVVLGVLSIGLSVMIIRFSKTAFVLGTVLSFNPVLWIINGIYIKNRWNDPRVLENEGEDDLQEAHHDPVEESARPTQVIAAISISSDTIEPDQGYKQDLGNAKEDVEPTHSEEDLWEKALQEVESSGRRLGLWAKCFSEASGVESAAKANYMAVRFAEMKKAILADLEKQQEWRRVEEDERQPKGTCPSCKAIIPLASEECSKCKALFGPDSSWSVKPLSRTAAI